MTVTLGPWLTQTRTRALTPRNRAWRGLLQRDAARRNLRIEPAALVHGQREAGVLRLGGRFGHGVVAQIGHRHFAHFQGDAHRGDGEKQIGGDQARGDDEEPAGAPDAVC